MNNQLLQETITKIEKTTLDGRSRFSLLNTDTVLYNSFLIYAVVHYYGHPSQKNESLLTFAQNENATLRLISEVFKTFNQISMQYTPTSQKNTLKKINDYLNKLKEAQKNDQLVDEILSMI